MRVSNPIQLFIGGAFHHSINFAQLLLIIFKDVISFDYIPGFYISISNKSEILYFMVFKSLKKILIQKGFILWI